jgi:hypothetical protein
MSNGGHHHDHCRPVFDLFRRVLGRKRRLFATTPSGIMIGLYILLVEA